MSRRHLSSIERADRHLVKGNGRIFAGMGRGQVPAFPLPVETRYSVRCAKSLREQPDNLDGSVRPFTVSEQDDWRGAFVSYLARASATAIASERGSTG